MTIDRLIVNTPYKEPRQHWGYQRETRTFRLEDGRRAAGYVVASPDSRAFDDPGIFVEIPLVNQIRPRVKAWREAGYPGVTSITKRLLEHWYDPEEFNRRWQDSCHGDADRLADFEQSRLRPRREILQKRFDHRPRADGKKPPRRSRSKQPRQLLPRFLNRPGCPSGIVAV